MVSNVVTFAIICFMQDWVMPGRWLRALIISPAGMQPGETIEIIKSRFKEHGCHCHKQDGRT